MGEQLKAGPRQTVCQVIHPQRGAGVVVYRNGPSFFQPEGGEPVALKVIGSGCAVDRGSYLKLRDPEHGEIEAKLVQRGEHHDRKWSPLLGAGWLVSEPGLWFRFEADDGRTVRFEFARGCVGTPDYAARYRRSKTKAPPITPEEDQWVTLESRDGSVLAFRKGPPPAGSPQPTEPAQLGLFGGAR